MDIDGFITAHTQDWQRLDELMGSVNGRRRLTAAQIDELVRLYERVSTHLSIARTRFDDHALNVTLTGRVGRARALIYGSRAGTWRDATRFFTHEFPGAVWEARWAVLVSFLLFIVPAVASATWLANSPAALNATMDGDAAARAAYIEEEFEAYYSSQPAAQFASLVTTNNIRVSITAFAGGVLACVPTIVVMVINGLVGGQAAGLFAAFGQMPRFWGLVLPHGLLELTAVFIAGGAGLRLGWTLIDPGDRPRTAAMAAEGRRSVVIVVGLIVAFVVAGIIEGFVTGSTLPTWVRVGIGVAAATAFLGYLLVRGPAATRAPRASGRPADTSPEVHSRPVALVSR